jgi:hypothetical protein
MEKWGVGGREGRETDEQREGRKTARERDRKRERDPCASKKGKSHKKLTFAKFHT